MDPVGSGASGPPGVWESEAAGAAARAARRFFADMVAEHTLAGRSPCYDLAMQDPKLSPEVEPPRSRSNGAAVIRVAAMAMFTAVAASAFVVRVRMQRERGAAYRLPAA